MSHGAAPAPVPLPHFPDALHAVVWRNRELVPPARLARMLRAAPEEIAAVAAAMGLPRARPVSEDQRRRSYITVIGRNWHLLPYEQLLKLLGWDAEQMAFTLREDDFLWHKLGQLKPACAPVYYALPSPEAQHRAAQIREVVEADFGAALHAPGEVPFAFLQELSAPVPRDVAGTGCDGGTGRRPFPTPTGRIGPRFLYSYFALYGDPLLRPECDPYPDGYLLPGHNGRLPL